MAAQHAAREPVAERRDRRSRRRGCSPDRVLRRRRGPLLRAGGDDRLGPRERRGRRPRQPLGRARREGRHRGDRQHTVSAPPPPPPPPPPPSPTAPPPPPASLR